MLEKIRRNSESFAQIFSLGALENVNYSTSKHCADELANSPNCHIKKCMKLSKENQKHRPEGIEYYQKCY